MSLSDIVVEDRIGVKAFERPQFKRLMAQALHGSVQFDVLLVHSPCRITRNPERLAFLLKRLERANVQVKMITGEMPAKLA
jgi:DNA invertase Pin-like site-specific DNA recombinase